MNFWETVAVAIGSGTAAVTALTFLAKSLFQLAISRDTRVFEAKLKSTTDAEIERLKNEMNPVVSQRFSEENELLRPETRI